MTTTFSKVVNNAISTIVNNPLAIGGTNLIVTNSMDAILNSIGAFPYYLTMWGQGLTPDSDTNREIVQVTARASANNYTIVRARQSTVAKAWNFNDNVALLWTSGNASEIDTAINNLETNIPINVQNEAYTYADDTGSANAYAIAPSPVISGYVKGQSFVFKASFSNTGAATLNVNGAGPKNIVKNGNTTALIANDIRINQMITVVYDGVSFQLDSQFGNAPLTQSNIKFGGTGSDGPLAVTSGNTNIDCANAAIVVKNYTTISITGTGSVTFINPNANGTVIVMKSQADVTLTSSAAPMINASKMGSAGGTVVTATSTTAGNAGSNGFGIYFLTNKGSGGTAGPGGGNPGLATVNTSSFTATLVQQAWKYYNAFVGAGGGSGTVISNLGYSATSGKGGAGGGALYIECCGSFNFTTASGISVGGENGGNGTGGASSTAAGGGGGGGGGYCQILYNTLTANSGTIVVAGGTGGNASSTGTNTAGGGGGGSFSNPGIIGTTATSSVKTGGNGGAGASFVGLNTDLT